MIDTKFTPGPWKWQRQNEQEWPSYDLSPGVLTKDTADGTLWGDEIDRANAHLIAAAPELYEALDDIVSSWSDTDNIDEDEYLRRISARAALAKARGEA